DLKHTALKALQGMLWAEGYRNGDFTAPVYPDVVRRLQQWHAQGHTLAVYSSGSVPSQVLFFTHSDAGDLSPLFSAWFDTETGGKREADSYTRIARRLEVPPAEIPFLSDVVAELDAARYAGMPALLRARPQVYGQCRAGAAPGR